jgi:hypothetical protein
MKATSLGHLGWHLADGTTALLVNPVLEGSFGSTHEHRFFLFPRRTIALAEMGHVDGIVLTNEHIQNFHPPSLALMPRSVPIFIGCETPPFLRHILLDLGFTVERLGHGESRLVGTIEFALFRGASTTLAMDGTVHSLLVTSTKSNATLAIQSECRVHPDLVTRATAPGRKLKAFVATHNFQLRANGTLGFLSNAFPLPDESASGFVGIEVLNGILNEVSEHFGVVEAVILAGNGYTTHTDGQPMFRWDNQTLAGIANSLSLWSRVFAPLPSDTIHLDGSRVQIESGAASWVRLEPLCQERPQSKIPDEGSEVEAAYLESALPALTHERENEFLGSELKVALSSLRKALLLSDLGEELLRVSSFLEGPLGPRRLVLRLCREGRNPEPLLLALDLSRGEFVEVPSSEDATLMRRYPFGLDLPLSDLEGLLRGAIQFWELATLGVVRQWYVCDRMKSPVCFMLTYFSERLHPALAESTYRSSLTLRGLP